MAIDPYLAKVGGAAQFDNCGRLMSKFRGAPPPIDKISFDHTARKRYHAKTPTGLACTIEKTVHTKAAIYNDKGTILPGTEWLKKRRHTNMTGRSKAAVANAKVVHGFVNTKGEIDAKLDSVYTPAPLPGLAQINPRFGKGKALKVARSR